jgi:hypothetical protein
MRRYLFRLKSSGIEAADRLASDESARRAARIIASELTRNRRSFPGGYLQILDEAGLVLHQEPLF